MRAFTGSILLQQAEKKGFYASAVKRYDPSRSKAFKQVKTATSASVMLRSQTRGRPTQLRLNWLVLSALAEHLGVTARRVSLNAREGGAQAFLIGEWRSTPLKVALKHECGVNGAQRPLSGRPGVLVRQVPFNAPEEGAQAWLRDLWPSAAQRRAPKHACAFSSLLFRCFCCFLWVLTP